MNDCLWVRETRRTVARGYGMAGIALLDTQLTTGEFRVLVRIAMTGQNKQTERDHEGQRQAQYFVGSAHYLIRF